jgi:hypothetical protein
MGLCELFDRKGGKLKMSILQDYERIRRDLLPGEFKTMERYLEAHGVYLSDIYYDQEAYKDFRSWWKTEKKEDEEE